MRESASGNMFVDMFLSCEFVRLLGGERRGQGKGRRTRRGERTGGDVGVEHVPQAFSLSLLPLDHLFAFVLTCSSLQGLLKVDGSAQLSDLLFSF